MRSPIARRTLAIVTQDRREARCAWLAVILQRLDELSALIRAHRDSIGEGKA
jgi:hypothetical protein